MLSEHKTRWKENLTQYFYWWTTAKLVQTDSSPARTINSLIYETPSNRLIRPMPVFYAVLILLMKMTQKTERKENNSDLWEGKDQSKQRIHKAKSIKITYLLLAISGVSQILATASEVCRESQLMTSHPHHHYGRGWKKNFLHLLRSWVLWIEITN